MIHRNLRLENLSLEEGLNLKVASFSSSRIIDPGQKLTGIFGSADYMASEVAERENNEQCDVWSCGVIC